MEGMEGQAAAAEALPPLMERISALPFEMKATWALLFFIVLVMVMDSQLDKVSDVSPSPASFYSS